MSFVLSIISYVCFGQQTLRVCLGIVIYTMASAPTSPCHCTSTPPPVHTIVVADPPVAAEVAQLYQLHTATGRLVSVGSQAVARATALLESAAQDTSPIPLPVAAGTSSLCFPCGLTVCTQGWPLLRVRTSGGFEHHLVEPTHADALHREGRVLNSATKRSREEE